MNWRDILYLDLGGLLSGGGKVPETHDDRAHDADSELGYKPGSYYRNLRLGKRSSVWPGPGGFHKSPSQEFYAVINEVLALVRSGVPLVGGLEAAAREIHQNPARRRTRNSFIALGAALLVCILVLPGGNVQILKVLLEILLTPVVLMAFAYLIFQAGHFGRVEAIFLALRRDLAQGFSLSQAMGRRHRFFAPWVVALVEAGEESGRLEEVLEETCTKSVEAMSQGDRLKALLIYPVAAFIIAAGVAGVVMYKVVPVIIETLRELDEALPRSALMLDAAHKWLANYWGLLIPVVMLVAMLFYALTAGRAMLFGRRLSDLTMRVPGMRRLVVAANLCSFCPVLEKLLSAGVPLCKALEAAEQSGVSPLYGAMLARVRERCENGASLAQACEPESLLLPPSFLAMTALGERSGMLAEAFASIGKRHADAMRRWNHVLVAAVQPVSILMLAVIVLLLTTAVFSMLVRIADSLIV
jgi:type II secretory pathway component PulF